MEEGRAGREHRTAVASFLATLCASVWDKRTVEATSEAQKPESLCLPLTFEK
jgi:hypothetical protein